MRYEEALEYMESLNKRGIHPGLEGIRALVSGLGHPEKGLSVIQVAGTNGKGSVSLYLQRILMAAGYRTGLYQSPAVLDEREIIRINGRSISKADYARLTAVIGDVNTPDISATRFECETAMALLYFREKECDCVILEAGLGGRDDATNLTEGNILSVITPIGLDHMAMLGATEEAIAEIKAGVIKGESLCVSAEQLPEVEAVLKKRAGAVGAGMTFVRKSDIRSVKYLKSGTEFTYKALKGLRTSRLGVCQPENAALAAEAAFSLQRAGLEICEKDIRKGIAEATDFGRFEKIGDRPVFIIDGAHNEPAALRLRESIETYFTNRKIVYIMGMFKDKDSEAVARITADLADSVITVTLPNKARSMTGTELAEVLLKYNPMVTAADSISEAVELARLMCPKDGVIIAFGSLSFLKDIKKAAEIKVKRDFHGVRDDR